MAVGEEEETKQQQLRNQSKRSRAAEVHNLSEKVLFMEANLVLINLYIL